MDRTTVAPFLESMLQEWWREVAANSPNRRPGASVRLVRIDEPTPSALAGLLGHLLDWP